jgi:hypothetical protein
MGARRAQIHEHLQQMGLMMLILLVVPAMDDHRGPQPHGRQRGEDGDQADRVGGYAEIVLAEQPCQDDRADEDHSLAQQA